MAEQVGTLLWNLRTARGWSLGQLAERAGVSKAALSRWESGKRQPFIPELEATLNALEASADQRALALACIEAPRALRLLKEPSVSDRLGPPPSIADLLRAMRLRGEWTQEHIALRVGVRQHTIARWESGERLPSPEEIQALCFALEAQEPEFIALTTGNFSAAPEEIPIEEDAVAEYLGRLIYSPPTYLEDLQFLTIERALWREAVQNEAAQQLLARACAYHAHYLGNHQRWQETRAVATRVLDLTPRQATEPEYVLRAVLKLAAAVVYTSHRPAPERGIQLLQSYLPRSASPDYTAWMLADMAKYSTLAGQPNRGLALAREAVQMTKQETEMRLIDYSNLLLANGQPGEALRNLPELSEQERGVFVYGQMVKAEAYLALGDREAAHTELARAYNIINAYALKGHRQMADALARQL